MGQESSRSTSPWTEVEERACWSQPWEKRTFPLSEDEIRDLETEDRLWSGTSGQEDTGSETRETRATCGSMESSRATSRSVEVRLVKLRSDSQHSRSSSIDEVAEEGQEVEHLEDNNTD